MFHKEVAMLVDQIVTLRQVLFVPILEQSCIQPLAGIVPVEFIAIDCVPRLNLAPRTEANPAKGTKNHAK